MVIMRVVIANFSGDCMFIFSAVMVDFMASIARSAPTLPFYYYDINFITGIYNRK